MIEINYDPKKGLWAEKEDADRLRNNSFGEQVSDKLWLNPEEALYIIDLMNGKIKHGKAVMGFGDIVIAYASKDTRLMIKYNAYRDWRDRGLIVKRVDEYTKGGSSRESHVKKYPENVMKIRKSAAKIIWDSESAMGVFDDKAGIELYKDWWLGQIGVYKQERGSILKLNFFEVMLLSKRFGFKVVDAKTGKATTSGKIMDEISKRREFAKAMYQAYEDWRLRGYIVKTGFKFGTHFRIYFPDASPLRETGDGKWVHSKHVLHIFPKEEKLLVSEWARAVRVAHGVKKTFILGVPKITKKDFMDYPADFAAYRRKKRGKDWIREAPPKDRPRYLLAAMSEEEHIGGVELASLLAKSAVMGMNLILSITDRETAITYYALNKIRLRDSEYDYYEIEWLKP
ncbi:MAG: tRNA-intron lyase [Candidatus Aenigmarchaeota archaeon]|nr:tRNA-intron lyase [Candidatus Aenigmarchaeota archaeon]